MTQATLIEIFFLSLQANYATVPLSGHHYLY